MLKNEKSANRNNTETEKPKTFGTKTEKPISKTAKTAKPKIPMPPSFWKCQKTEMFWENFVIWLQSCQILQPGSYLDMTTALGLTPDSSSFKLHINFCCLIAKNFIWICRSKECHPNHNNFLLYLRHLYQLENKTPSNIKNGNLFYPR